MSEQNITVVKANGKTEPFSEGKIYHSLERARVPKEYQHEIVDDLKRSLGDRVSSKDIFDHIKQYFHNTKPHLFAKYNLKMAIMQLGPSGYPFERYVGALLQHYGFNCRVSQVVMGKCVSHEVDVLADKADEHYIVECKFHNEPGSRSDVKVSLYIKARFDDIIDRLELSQGSAFDPKTYHGWLVTNTKCTSDALTYAQCAHINVVGWNYPEKGNLQDMVEEAGLYPVTALSAISQTHKELLLSKNIVLAKELLEHEDTLTNLHLAEDQRKQLDAELAALFTGHGTP